MNDVVKIAGIAAVLGVQLIGPLVIGWRELNAFERPAPATKAGRTKAFKRKRGRAAVADQAPALAPLRCAKCQAPVPLQAASFACPHCAAPLTPPADYVHALALRLKSDQLLAAAERMWRHSRVVCAWPTVWFLRLLLVAWTVLVMGASYAAADLGVPGMVVFLPIIVAIVQVFLGFFLLSVIGDGRRELPPLPPRSSFAIAAAEGTCAGCTAPFVFAAHRFAATCRYCGAENFRAALAQTAKDTATKDEGAARGSFMAQIKVHQARRHEVLGFFTIIGVAEVFYGVLIPVGFVMSLLEL